MENCGAEMRALHFDTARLRCVATVLRFDTSALRSVARDTFRYGAVTLCCDGVTFRYERFTFRCAGYVSIRRGYVVLRRCYVSMRALYVVLRVIIPCTLTNQFPAHCLLHKKTAAPVIVSNWCSGFHFLNLLILAVAHQSWIASISGHPIYRL